MTEGNAEFKGQMKQWVKHFEAQRIEDVAAEKERHFEIITKLDNHHSEIQEQFKNHKEYHKENEHKWGMWALFKKKPLIPLILGAIIIIIAIEIGWNYKEILKEMVKLAK
jgi:hypothetical protein